MPRVLLIDVDAPLREAPASALAATRRLVMQIADGRQTNNLFHVEPANREIADLIMPDCEELEIIVELHCDRPAATMIAMFGGVCRSERYLVTTAKLGARGPVAKPFSSAEPWRTVAEVLTKPQSVGSAP